MYPVGESLSEVLTKFYPLAGRIINDELLVDCDDQGVDYLEAQVSGELDEFLSKGPDMELLDQFVPLGIGPVDSVTSPLLAIQINNFNCGGLVVGVRISHKIVDASSIATFINGWANASRVGIGGVVTCPNLDMAAHFPARTSFRYKLPPPTNDGPKLVMKRFVFEGASILALKDKAKGPGVARQPLRVVVVTAVLWKALICIAQPKHGQLMRSSMIHIVNLRGKTGLLLPENSFGNLLTAVRTKVKAGERKVELEDLTGLLGDAIRDIKASFATKLQGDEISLMWISLIEESMKGFGERTKVEDFHTFSSWCRFPLYEADFGWGKPNWISPAALDSEVCILMDTKCGDGIEAWVNLKEEDTIELERDPDILANTASAYAYSK